MTVTRRTALLTGLALAAPASAQVPPDIKDPTSPGAPPQGGDAYGLDAFFKTQPYIERALRELDEPDLLTPKAKIAVPTFRLLELHRRPRSARILFDREDGGATVVLKEYPGAAARSIIVGGKPIPDAFFNRATPGILSLNTVRGLKLRLLVDDEDRFWNGAVDPPRWGEILAESHNEIYVTADGWTVSLEGRIGAKRHAIVRSSPASDSWLGQISEAVFGGGAPD